MIIMNMELKIPAHYFEPDFLESVIRKELGIHGDQLIRNIKNEYIGELYNGDCLAYIYKHEFVCEFKDNIVYLRTNMI